MCVHEEINKLLFGEISPAENSQGTDWLRLHSLQSGIERRHIRRHRSPVACLFIWLSARLPWINNHNGMTNTMAAILTFSNFKINCLFSKRQENFQQNSQVVSFNLFFIFYLYPKNILKYVPYPQKTVITWKSCREPAEFCTQIKTCLESETGFYLLLGRIQRSSFKMLTNRHLTQVSHHALRCQTSLSS